MSHIYSKEHQRLLKMPVMKFPSMTDEKYDLEIAYDMDAIDKDLEAYNNWLKDDKINPVIPPEYQEHFYCCFFEGQELVAGVHFEIENGLAVPIKEKYAYIPLNEGEATYADADNHRYLVTFGGQAEGVVKKVPISAIIKESPDEELYEIANALSMEIIKEEQSKDDNVVSGNKSIEQELATISIYGRPLSTFLLSDQIQKIAEWLTSHYQLKKKA